MNFCFIWTDFAFACAWVPLPSFSDFWIRLIKLFNIFIIRTSGIKRADILFRCKTNLVWKKFRAKFCSSLPGSSVSCSNVQVNLKITWKAWLTSFFCSSDLNLLSIYTFFIHKKWRCLSQSTVNNLLRGLFLKYGLFLTKSITKLLVLK